ncbi:MAG: sugar transferase [Phycisphaerae bacterium]|nr:sugar transferase [Phycisphaerae bacterium]
MDLGLSILSLIVLSPLLALVALLVKCTSRGPVFYADVRQGRGGREFRCMKFRTMVRNAAELQAELRAKNEVDGPQFKMANDPRLTPIGGWLRRYNIDELPQLFNVLIGQMSLVGPRPSPDRENQLCPGWRRTRLTMRPGITGLWQVLRLRGDAPSDFQEWIYYDVEYARHQSLWLDVQLLIYTPLTMMWPGLLDRFAEHLARKGICAQSIRLQIRRRDRETEKEAHKPSASAAPGD